MLPEAGRCLRMSIAQDRGGAQQPPYNYLIHTSPLNVRR
jgi:hypothetical protein